MTPALWIGGYIAIAIVWAYVAGKISKDEIVGVFAILWPLYTVFAFFGWLSKLGARR